MRTQKVSKKATKPKPRRTTKRRAKPPVVIPVADPSSWRALAEDAIKAYGDLVDEIGGRDLVEDATFTAEISKPLFALQRRALVLAGQREMFK